MHQHQWMNKRRRNINKFQQCDMVRRALSGIKSMLSALNELEHANSPPERSSKYFIINFIHLFICRLISPSCNPEAQLGVCAPSGWTVKWLWVVWVRMCVHI